MNQVVRDWKEHPITSNFFKEAQDIRKQYAESILSGECNGDMAETSRRIGLIQGIDALLGYDPQVDEDGVIIE